MKEFDTNGDSKLNADEFNNLAAKLGIPTFEKLSADIKKDGYVEGNELLALMSPADMPAEKPKENVAGNSQPKKDGDDKAEKPKDDKPADAELRSSAFTGPAAGKPDYFAINKDRMHGINRAEMKAFLNRFADNGVFTQPKLSDMLSQLHWNTARFAKPFLKDLKADMTTTEVVDKIFKKLDADNSGGLVRGEMGDLVAPRKHPHHAKAHKTAAKVKKQG